MIKKILLLTILSFLVSCIKQPNEPDIDIEYFMDAWEILKIYSIYQDKLPENPFIYSSPKTLYSSLGDPYTVYYDQQTSASYTNSMTTNQSVGIGIIIGLYNDTFYIKHVINNSPAQHAGLHKYDTLISADSTSLIGISNENFSDALMGTEGSKLNLIVLRDTNFLPFEITRGYYTIPSVYADTLDENVSYICILEFMNYTADTILGTYGEFKSKINETNDFKIRIIDLRGNPGGIIDQALNITGMFLDDYEIIINTTEREFDEHSQQGTTINNIYRTNNIGELFSDKFVFLVDSSSASASEMITSAILDHRSDIVVMGSNTYGKAVGQVLYFSYISGSLYKITNTKIYTSKGFDYDSVGLEPNIVLDSNDNWLNRAYEKALDLAGISSKAFAKKSCNSKLKEISLNKSLLRPTSEPLLIMDIIGKD